jgi:hypothetical protein
LYLRTILLLMRGSLSTTGRYLSVATSSICSTASPLDLLAETGSDNSTELTSVGAHRPAYIQPGKPLQNVFVERRHVAKVIAHRHLFAI